MRPITRQARTLITKLLSNWDRLRIVSKTREQIAMNDQNDGNTKTQESKIREPINRHYVSELDRFLEAFDKKPEATSASRLAEEKKYQRIFQLRDKADVETHSKIWEKF